MAGFDGNGPRGSGPMTGRGMGYCAGDVSETPYYGRGIGRSIARRRPEMGRGFGRAFGRGVNCRAYGRGFGRYAVEDAEYVFDSNLSLEDEKSILEQRLNRVNQDLKNLKEE